MHLKLNPIIETTYLKCKQNVTFNSLLHCTHLQMGDSNKEACKSHPNHNPYNKPYAVFKKLNSFYHSMHPLGVQSFQFQNENYTANS